MTDTQSLQDMLDGAINQRNAAQHECVQLAAALKASQRKVAELEEKLKAAEVGEPELPLAPVKNGHDGDGMTVQ